MKFKKFLSVLTCGAMVCSLSACGSSAASDATDEVAETSEATESSIEEASAENSIEFSDADFSETSFSGSVTAIDQNIITLSIMNGGAGGGASSAVESYDAVQEYTSDTEVTNESFTSTGTDENAIHIYDSASVALNNIEITRTSDDSAGGDNSMIGGSLTANNGGMFYTTNTECTFYISDVDITYADENDFFLRCTGNVNQRGWGSSGKNGSQCAFTADSQDMVGDVIYDSISELDFYMMDGSTLAGAFIDDESCAGNGGSGFCNVYISSDSVWTVTGDSSYTITVYSYSDSADFSGAATGDEFADYSIENPF